MSRHPDILLVGSAERRTFPLARVLNRRRGRADSDGVGIRDLALRARRATVLGRLTDRHRRRGDTGALVASLEARRADEEHQAPPSLADLLVAAWPAEEVDGRLDAWAVVRRDDLEALSATVDELRAQVALLEQHMLVDPFTGLANAASFEADHAQVHARRKRSEEPYSILMVTPSSARDPAGGDTAEDREVIALVASTVSETVRQTDRSYRYGEREIAVLLPGAGLREAVAAAERVRLAVERRSRARPGGSPVAVTVAAISAGFRHADPKEVIAELEDLLRGGCDAGGNTVVWPH